MGVDPLRGVDEGRAAQGHPRLDADVRQPHHRERQGRPSATTRASKPSTWYKNLYDDGSSRPTSSGSTPGPSSRRAGPPCTTTPSSARTSVVKQSPDTTLDDYIAPSARPVVEGRRRPAGRGLGPRRRGRRRRGRRHRGRLRAVAHLRPEHRAWTTSSSSGLPPTTEAALDSDVVTGDTLRRPRSASRSPPPPPSNPFWEFPQYAQMETAVAEQVQAVLIGQKSASDAMKTAGDTITGLI